MEFMDNLRIKLEQLERQRIYAYHCKAESKHLDRLWWQGYMDALTQVIEIIKEVLKQ